MLTEKTWKPELLLRLISSYLLCVGLGGFIIPMSLGETAMATAEGRFGALVVFSLVMHGGGLLLVSRCLAGHPMSWTEAFGFREGPPLKAIATGLCVSLAFLPMGLMLMQLCVVLMDLVRLMDIWDIKPVAQQAVEMLQETAIPMQQVYLGLVAIVLAPLVEEIFFRGILYTAIKQAGYKRAALWGSSLFFALIHANMAAFIPLTVLAFLLVWLYEKTGNLLSCIAAHAFFNLMNFIMLMNLPAIEEWLKKQQALIWF
ncbi:MAG: abortive infection protein [Verrucomicrobia bacterium]|nr:abortive infection protein [Verrucomicrobiota bacterium]